MVNYSFTLLTIPILAAALLAASLAVVGWQRRQSAGALLFSRLMVVLAWAYGTYALELANTTVDGKLFWLRLEYLAIPFMAPLILLAIQAYTQSRPIERPFINALLIIPIVTLILAWTPWSETLLWRNPVLLDFAPIYSIDFVGGPWYWVNMTYFFLLLIGAVSLLAQRYLTTDQQLYQQQIRMMGFAGLIIMAIMLPYFAGIFPYNIDASPFAFLPAGIMLAWGLFYYRAWDIHIVAHHSIIQNIHDGLITLDPDQRIVDTNPAVRALFPRAITGKPIEDALPADWLADFSPQEERVIEITRSEAQGTAHYELRFLPVYSRWRLLEGTLIMVREITRRKEAELAREETIDELDAFAHTVAHDLKNPLNVISGYTTLLAAGTPFSLGKTQEVMTTIHVTGKKMAAIIDELMLLAGLNQQEPEFGPVDMPLILEHLQTRMALLIMRQEAQISAPEEWPELVSYAPWIEEVLSNYISNAIKYGGEPPLVQVGAERLADGRVQLWVKDNGPGISPEDQARLFTPFTRLNQLDTKGHGLGLSIVQRIASRLGGEPTIESVMGQGSTFSLILPDLAAADESNAQVKKTTTLLPMA